MKNVRGWDRARMEWIRLLEENTGEGLDTWNKRIQKEGVKDEQSLRDWLTQLGVSGYAQTLLVMEQFGYPDFLTAPAEKLIDDQYADRPQLLPIFDAIVNASLGFGEVIIQARKSYVSLMSPRRTFARLVPATRNRLDLGLRLDGKDPEGRLKPSRIQETMKLQISLISADQIDDEVLYWLRRAYDESL